jgi:hypothetical protein
MTDMRSSRTIAPDGLPRSYDAASAAASRARNKYLHAVAANVVLILVGAVFAAISPHTDAARRMMNLLSAACFAGGLILTKTTSSSEYNREWVRERSRAEDVKSLAWRFMTAAEPFPPTLPTRAAVSAAHSRIDDINRQHRVTAENAPDEEVTPLMLDVRARSVADRLNVYLQARLDDQLRWYDMKTERSERLAKCWGGGLYVSQAIALAAAWFAVWRPGLMVNGHSIFAALSGVCVGWLRATEYRELATAYANAADMLKTFRLRSGNVSGDLQLNDFVNDVETALAHERDRWSTRRTVA